jgi:bacterioferritin-associated ferredoxin
MSLGTTSLPSLCSQLAVAREVTILLDTVKGSTNMTDVFCHKRFTPMGQSAVRRNVALQPHSHTPQAVRNVPSLQSSCTKCYNSMKQFSRVIRSIIINIIANYMIPSYTNNSFWNPEQISKHGGATGNNYKLSLNLLTPGNFPQLFFYSPWSATEPPCSQSC